MVVNYWGKMFYNIGPWPCPQTPDWNRRDFQGPTLLLVKYNCNLLDQKSFIRWFPEERIF